ncbi:MAG TPA: hypothetical protein VGO22_15835 [Pseudorhizobium sp.]|jgi:hypothetical protein|nr:hypothetical protein [Pseudorhizobium sp.]
MSFIPVPSDTLDPRGTLYVDVLTWWNEEVGSRHLSDQAEALANWIDRLLRGELTGLWGDDLFAEARQLWIVADMLASAAHENGFRWPLFTDGERDFLACCIEIHDYFRWLAPLVAHTASPQVEMRKAKLVGRH